MLKRPSSLRYCASMSGSTSAKPRGPQRPSSPCVPTRPSIRMWMIEPVETQMDSPRSHSYNAAGSLGGVIPGGHTAIARAQVPPPECGPHQYRKDCQGERTQQERVGEMLSCLTIVRHTARLASVYLPSHPLVTAYRTTFSGLRTAGVATHPAMKSTVGSHGRMPLAVVCTPPQSTPMRTALCAQCL
eukprot:scaffold2827_cov409-Prasinococcus_capsulatus_cf.AAC.2